MKAKKYITYNKKIITIKIPGTGLGRSSEPVEMKKLIIEAGNPPMGG
ncbi:MAG TPA: hypothetical protein GXX31_05030 [Methanothermobacter sp.]|nr:hypothetical protein [Methanothermobacter tenebrarum]MDI6881541.1 hypothetical protein [Methanothermobacter sp.]MDX9693047.1 hypothetical protein [Methanothermobacter sp.]HHW16723.1 hypothetical protein [Methanothermobacter sp.]HOQ19882.1 hypothetical protein [Methanothermobacter sp.]